MIDVKDCPRDQEVDTWFDEEFERQKTRGDKTAPVVLKDIDEAAAMMDNMMGDME